MNIRSEKGFTLIELLVVVAILGIICVGIVRGFTRYNANAEETRAQKEMMDLALQVEKYRSENFTFKGFPKTTMTLPLNATGNNIRYSLSIVDIDSGSDLTNSKSTGYSWAIKAVAKEGSSNYSLLLNSYGERCKNLSASRVTNTDCGDAIQGSKQW